MRMPGTVAQIFIDRRKVVHKTFSRQVQTAYQPTGLLQKGVLYLRTVPVLLPYFLSKIEAYRTYVPYRTAILAFSYCKIQSLQIIVSNFVYRGMSSVCRDGLGTGS